MNEQDYGAWKKHQEQWLSRRSLIRGAAGTALGAGLFHPKLAYANDEDGDSERWPISAIHRRLRTSMGSWG